MKQKKRLILLLLFVIVTLGFIVRLYRLNSPIADWHSWRQSDTSAVSRYFVTHGFDILHPHFEDLSNIPSGKDNPNGYRFVEFPLYNITQAGLYSIFGMLSLEAWGRIVSIIASSLSTIFIYLLVARHSSKTIGLFSAFFYAFIPYDIYYGRTILPDTSMAMAVLGGIYFFDIWIEKMKESKSRSTHWVWFLISLVFTASSFLLKPYALFFVLPMVVLAYNRWGIGFFKKWQLWIFLIISVIPLSLWRTYITQFPEGIPASAWLFNGNGIRFHPAFFRWIFFDRLTRLISGYFGILILLFGVLKVNKLREWLFFVSFLASSLLYITTIATGNVQHDYYQILIMPSVAIFYGIGSYFLYRWTVKKLPVGKIVLVVLVLGLFGYGWNTVKDYFNINHPSIVTAGDALDLIAPKDAKVIAYVEGEQGDTSLLYRTKRQGWPSLEKSFPEMVQMGASYMVLADPTPQALDLGKQFKIVAKGSNYIIFDLRRKP